MESLLQAIQVFSGSMVRVMESGNIIFGTDISTETSFEFAASFFQNLLPGGTSIAASLRKKWVNSVKRKDFIPCEQHRVCSQHFHCA